MFTSVALLALTGCASLPGIYQAPAGGIETAEQTGGTSAIATIGAPAPDAAFYGSDGRRHLLSEYKGKFLALVFFAHW